MSEEKMGQEIVSDDENLEEIAATLAEAAEEMEAAAKEDGVGADVYTHYLRHPFTYEGRTVEELSFDWGALTGRDSLAIERELRTKGITLILSAYTGEFLVGLAARACTDRTEDGKRFVGTDMIQALPLGEFQTITNRARNFLLRAGL